MSRVMDWEGTKLMDDVAEVLVTADEIEAKAEELGQQITEDYRSRDLLLVCVLKGGMTFLADLMRHIRLPAEIDFMAVSSYGGGTKSTGAVRILMDLETNIEGRNVLIVEDIIDTGRTLKYILENLEVRHPTSLKICTLMDKPSRRTIEIPVDYVGFTIPDKFVVGYGLDYAEIYRNLPFVGVLKADLYQEDD